MSVSYVKQFSHWSRPTSKSTYNVRKPHSRSWELDTAVSVAVCMLSSENQTVGNIFQVWWTASKTLIQNFFRILCTKKYSYRFIFDGVIQTIKGAIFYAPQCRNKNGYAVRSFQLWHTEHFDTRINTVTSWLYKSLPYDIHHGTMKTMKCWLRAASK